MQHFKIKYHVILASFLFFSLGLGILAEYLDRQYPSRPCLQADSKDDNFKRSMNFLLVSKDFWDQVCLDGNFLISSSEGDSEWSFNKILIQKNDLYLHSFFGQHRGLKTAAYILSQNIHKDRTQKLKLTVLINPVYWRQSLAEVDGAAAHQSALSRFSYSHRTGLGLLDLNLFSELVLTANEYLKNHILQYGYKLDLNADELLKKSFDEIPLVPPNYDLAHGMSQGIFREDFNSAFDWKFENRVPYMEDLLKLFENKAAELNVQYCLVLLPLNERFLKSGMKNLEENKNTILNYYKNSKNIVNLMNLGDEDFLFTDLMHFTDQGRILITQKIYNSECFRNLYGIK